MFGSWHLTSESSNPTLLRVKPNTHKACNNCRAKKVRCTGQLLGCERCEALDIQCCYRPTRGKKSGRRSRADSQKEDQAESSSAPAEAQPNHPGQLPPTTCPDLSSFSASFFDHTKESLNLSTQLGGQPPDFYIAFPESNLSLSTDTASPTLLNIDCSQWVFSTAQSPSYAPGETVDWGDAFAYISSPKSNSIIPEESPVVAEKTTIGPQTQVPEPGRAQEQCKCLQCVILLIGDLELDGNGHSIDVGDTLPTSHTGELDSALGLHKEGVRYGKMMLACSRCTSLSESRVLLLLLAKRLLAQSSRMVSTCQAIIEHGDASDTTTTDELPLDINVGEYKVDTTTECGLVLRALISTQLRALNAFVDCLADPDQLHRGEYLALRNKLECLQQRHRSPDGEVMQS